MAVSLEKMINVGIDDNLLKFGYNAAFAVDKNFFTGNYSKALESDDKVEKAKEFLRIIKVNAEKLYESIKKNTVRLAHLIGKRIRHFNIDIEAARNKAFRLEETLKQLEKVKPSFPTVKPEYKFMYLCNSKGFNSNFSEIAKATITLVKEHKSCLDSINSEQKQWLSAEPDSNLSDIEQWSMNSKAAIPSICTDKGGSWNGKKADGGNTLYVSEDQYGCRDFFVNAPINAKVDGDEVIDALENLEYDFVSNRFYKKTSEVFGQYTKLSTKQWRKICLEAGMGKNSDIDIKAELDSYKESNISTNVSLNKAYAFESLDIKDLMTGVESCIELCNVLLDWSSSAYKETWKTNLADEFSAKVKPDEYNDYTQVQRLVKARASAYLDLCMRYHGSVDNHAFKVVDSILSFVEKNIALYVSE